MFNIDCCQGLYYKGVIHEKLNAMLFINQSLDCVLIISQDFVFVKGLLKIFLENFKNLKNNMW